MAVTLRSKPCAATGEPVATFTMSLGPGDWKPGPAPAAGDLVCLMVMKPERAVAGPPGWTALPDGRSFWKIWGSSEQYTATFCAESALEWKVKGYAVAAGSYSLPGEVTPLGA